VRRIATLILPLLLTFTVFAQDAKKPVTVASKAFTESRVLAEIMAQLIETRTDIPVVRKHGLSGSLIAFTALKDGDIDIYPEYTGTAWSVVLKKQGAAKDPLETFLTVKNEFESQFNAIWLDPYGFSNSYAIAVRKETADKLKLANVSDIAGNESELKFGWSTEFLNRGDGWPGLSKMYGLNADGMRGMEHGLAYQAIGEGNVDVIDAYTTDGKLLKYKLFLLKDDKSFFPPYEAAPVIRQDAIDRYPELKPLLMELAFKIPAARMQQLNYDVEEQGKAFTEVAREFLIEEKLITASSKQKVAGTSRGGTNWEFAIGRIQPTLKLVGEHLVLTGLAVGLAILLAVPIGIYLTRYEKISGLVLGFTGVIQTIPSLALLAFMIPIPFLGLSMQSAVVALFLYALLPIVRNTYTGIKEVDKDLIDSAKGMGLRENEMLRHVQLPLALPTIMAGVRTATVISIGVATLAAFIGAGGLGEPIITGLQLNDPRLILAGAIPAALLALSADWLLGWIEKRLSPER
jgi:osmoprotectant transport system permease protein